MSEGNVIDRRARKKRGRGRRRKRRSSSERAVNAFIEGMTAPSVNPMTIPISLAVKFLIGLILIPGGWVTLETFFVSFGHANRVGAFWRTAEFIF